MQNLVILHGRLAQDLKTGTNKRQDGEEYTWVLGTIAVSGNTKDAKTEFIPFSATGTVATTMVQFLKKGSELVINGKLYTTHKEYGDKKVTEVAVNVSTFDFCGSKGTGETGGVGAATTGGTPAPTDPTAEFATVNDFMNV